MQTNPFLKNTDLIPLIKAPYTSFYVETSKACCALLCLVLIYDWPVGEIQETPIKRKSHYKDTPTKILNCSFEISLNGRVSLYLSILSVIFTFVCQKSKQQMFQRYHTQSLCQILQLYVNDRVEKLFSLSRFSFEVFNQAP